VIRRLIVRSQRRVFGGDAYRRQDKKPAGVSADTHAAIARLIRVRSASGTELSRPKYEYFPASDLTFGPDSENARFCSDRRPALPVKSPRMHGTVESIEMDDSCRVIQENDS
jgi:hypothetical protein